MGKKTDKKLGKFFAVLAVWSVVFTTLEGWIFYSDAYPHPLFRWMLIIQNTIKAFAFRSDIGLKDMAEVIGNSGDIFEKIVGYAYTVAIFAAPYCTLAVMYKVLEKFFRFRSLLWRFSKERRIIIFGYNEEVKILLDGEYEDARIHLIATEVSRETEVELLKKKVVLHRIECLKLPEKQLKYFFKRMELKVAEHIILFEESSAKNFSLYQMFHRDEFIGELNDTVRFICRCEDESIRRIIEDFHDCRLSSAKEKEKEGKEKNQAEKRARDLEIVGIHELRVRKMLEEHSLHQYYVNSGKEVKDWKLHLLIIGFGKLGQQILLQSMNMGVVSSENDILIDVVDFDVENKKSIFENHFSDKYVKMDDEKLIIPRENADGKFEVRFHKMDTRYRQFCKILQENGDPKKDGIYTYVAICIEDADVSLHCMSEVERYLKENTSNGEKGKVGIGVRMESNRQMAKYVSGNSATYKNVFVIEETESTISLQDLLHDDLTKDAKEFNYIYSMMDIKSAQEFKKKSEDEREKNRKELIEDCWKNMLLFKRNSNLAIAQHANVREMIPNKFSREMLEKYFGENGSILKDEGNVWTFKEDEAELVDNLNNCKEYAQVLEYAKLEHRRWCYFMASCGWRSLNSMNWVKDSSIKGNACLCTWDELSTKAKKIGNEDPKYYACKYDLMPLLMEYIKRNASK